MKNAYGKYLNQNKKSYNNYIIFSPTKDDCFGFSNINNKKQNNSMNIDNGLTNNNIKDNKQINNNLNEMQNINRNIFDPRLELVFKYLSIENNLPIFINNNINFNDLLILTRKDLIDLGLSMIDRNRILYFSQQFIKYAKNYSLNEINSFFQENKNLYNRTISNNTTNTNNSKTNSKSNNNTSNNNNNNNNNKNLEGYNNNQKNENKILLYSNGFESKNYVNKNNKNNKNDVINNYNYKNMDKEKERDSQQEIDYCNIFPVGCISQSRTNTSSKNNNNNSICNKVDYFLKYQELTQEVDNYMFKFNEYKQNWNDSKRKYDNLMNSYLVRGKLSENKKNKNKKKIKNVKNLSHNPRDDKDKKINKKTSSNIKRESLEKLQKLKERKEELKKQLETIRDKSNHKKMIINYLDEN